MNRGASASCFSYWLWNQVSVGLINVHLFVSVILVSLYYSGRETPVTEKKKHCKYFIISATAAPWHLC